MTTRTVGWPAGVAALLAAVLAASVPALAVSPQPPLRIGGRAPQLMIERWLRGEPVGRFERGTVYVLDFWAVWCAPCLSGMAHTSDLADRFRDHGVRVIGLTGPDNAGNTLEAVERTLSRRGSTMRIDIAWDRPVRPDSMPSPEVLLGLTTLTYFNRTQIDGLPAAVIVDREGRLAWLGLPSALEAPLTAIVEGRWDLKAAAQRDQARRLGAAALTDLTDDTVLATLARVHFVRGDPAAAVAAQEAALALMDPPLPKQVSVLETYRQALKTDAGRK